MQIKILIVFALAFLFTDCKSESSDKKSNQEVVSNDKDLLMAQLLYPKLRLWDSTIAPVTFNDEQEKNLIASTTSPPALSIRNAINDYLSGKYESEYYDKSALGKNDNNGIGLSAFSKDYYKNKFLVLSFQDTPNGDMEVFLLPQSNPDRVLVALMKNKGTGENVKFVLISFYNSNYTDIEVHQIRNKFVKYVKDPKYGF